MSQNAARLAIAAIVIYQALLILLILCRSWRSLLAHDQRMGARTVRRLMSTAFLIAALSYLALLVALKSELHGRMGRVGQIILLLCAIGTVGVSLFTTDALDATSLSINGLLHIIFGTTALVLLPFAALSINLNLALNTQRGRPRGTLCSGPAVCLCSAS